ncbi:hypothetical protein HME9304_00055 [Flagellimonas maritima]|uniref:Adenylosuccinate lyase n=2 Tax=Flagellimonas maritima TaxID=1383885 RepID=A0A2Z4LNX9_9FLAO|nr:hypothetical protein HME9304_00055 [Allomuricauda aurantiaca]
MTQQQLHTALNSNRLSKQRIMELVDILIHKPQLTGSLLQEVFQQDREDNFNASWVFDHLMRERLIYLLPHLETFSKGLSTLKSESVIRPMSHICELCTIAYFKNKDMAFQQQITSEQLERIMTVCFDWLIGNHKVAAKVFAMTSLYWLGMKYDWVHTELKIILEQNIHKGTAGYKFRAGKILSELRGLHV